MNEAQKKFERLPVNRIPTPTKEARVKEILTEVQARKRAGKELSSLSLQFHGRKSLLQLLPVIKLRLSELALTLAIERIERKRNELSMEDLFFFEQFKKSLEPQE
jgi:hypothetical protein